MMLNQDFSKEFILSFVERLSQSMIDSRMVRVMTYPNIEQIKENIKIYEKPESNLANAIIMNQDPSIQKLMTEPYGTVKEISNNPANINSIMPVTKEVLPQNVNLPRPIKPLPMKVLQQKNIVQNKNSNRMPSPYSQPMPFMHKETGVRRLPMPMNRIPNPGQNMPAPNLNNQQETTSLLDLPKIDSLLSDPGVQTVECPGPDKPVLLYKNGAIVQSKLKLNAEEINEIMKDISEKTRIPLMSGVFKAAYGNLVITSVVSEFVGTRFIVQKKSKISPPRPNKNINNNFKLSLYRNA